MKILLIVISLSLMACAKSSPSKAPAIPSSPGVVDTVAAEMELSIKPLVGKSRSEIEQTWSDQGRAVGSKALEFEWQLNSDDRELCKFHVKIVCSVDSNRRYQLIFDSNYIVSSYEIL